MLKSVEKCIDCSRILVSKELKFSLDALPIIIWVLKIHLWISQVLHIILSAYEFFLQTI